MSAVRHTRAKACSRPTPAVAGTDAHSIFDMQDVVQPTRFASVFWDRPASNRSLRTSEPKAPCAADTSWSPGSSPSSVARLRTIHTV